MMKKLWLLYNSWSRDTLWIAEHLICALINEMIADMAPQFVEFSFTLSTR